MTISKYSWFPYRKCISCFCKLVGSHTHFAVQNKGIVNPQRTLNCEEVHQHIWQSQNSYFLQNVMAQPYSLYASKISQIFLGKIPPSLSPSHHLQFHTPTQYWRNLSMRGTVPEGISFCSYTATGTTAPLHLLCWRGLSIAEKSASLSRRQATINFLNYYYFCSPSSLCPPGFPVHHECCKGILSPVIAFLYAQSGFDSGFFLQQSG